MRLVKGMGLGASVDSSQTSHSLSTCSLNADPKDTERTCTQLCSSLCTDFCSEHLSPLPPGFEPLGGYGIRSCFFRGAWPRAECTCRRHAPHCHACVCSAHVCLFAHMHSHMWVSSQKCHLIKVNKCSILMWSAELSSLVLLPPASCRIFHGTIPCPTCSTLTSFLAL